MAQIINIRSRWPEKKGFTINRADLGNEYIFIHFITAVDSIINGKITKLEEGACIIYAAHGSQYFNAAYSDLIHDWCHITGDVVRIMKKYSLELNTPYYPGNDKLITEVMQDMEIEFIKKRKFSDEICSLLCEKLFALIGRLSQAEECENAKTEKFILLRSEVLFRFGEDWTVEKMARLAGMSVSRFFDAYISIFGISPQKDLQNTRIEHAKRILLSRDRSVEETAELTGYKSSCNFIRQFRKICGVTPGQYRGKS